jgi:hypothetical protein
VRTCKVVRLGSTDPNAAVVTAGRLWAGDALNVIPEHAQIGISAVFWTRCASAVGADLNLTHRWSEPLRLDRQGKSD